MHKLGVVVPYRDRYDQLQVFYDHVIPYLDTSGIAYRVIIVEQDDAKAFNRGMLCNIGFLEAAKLHCDYVVFHDIDLLPIDVDYSFSEHPIHLASDKLPFNTYFGGITLFPSTDFKKINGFSNMYWGWGFEDDDLRLRCHNYNIDYGVEESNNYTYDGPTAVFNGSTAYAEIENKIKTLRDFSINLGLRLGDYTYSTIKQTDEYTILSIPGYDFKLEYTSFNRLYLSFFDKDGIHYDITSGILLSRNYTVTINYIARNRTVTLKTNEQEVGTVQLGNKIYINSGENIIIGTNKLKTNFYSGTIDFLSITSNNEPLIDIVNSSLENKNWINKADKSIQIIQKNVEFKHFEYPTKKGNKIPHRRQSIIQRIEHEDQGYSQGVWKHRMTRWNQIRLNNGIINNGDTNNYDGLNTCEYTVISKSKKRKIVELKVGI